jgi:hypothetical protein
MQMQLASIPVLSQPPLAAMPQLSEKPHQGFATKKTAWNPGPNVCNFTVTLGLQVVVSENGVRKTYSARYYNPVTGRFMSRDPGKSRTTAPDATRNDLNSDAKQEVSFYLFGGPASTPVSSAPEGCLNSSLSDEDIRVPQAQHKYNYANSDPINRIDPSGRDSMIEFSLEDSEIEVEEEGVKAGRCAVVKNLCWSGCFLAVTSAGIHGADAFGDTRACTRRCMAAAGCFSY